MTGSTPHGCWTPRRSSVGRSRTRGWSVGSEWRAEMDAADRALLTRFANLAGGWTGLSAVGVDAVVVVDVATGTITARWTDVVAGWCLATAQSAVYLLDRGAADGSGRVRK